MKVIETIDDMKKLRPELDEPLGAFFAKLDSADQVRLILPAALGGPGSPLSRDRAARQARALRRLPAAAGPPEHPRISRQPGHESPEGPRSFVAEHPEEAPFFDLSRRHLRNQKDTRRQVSRCFSQLLCR